jgi:hypothetical protein
MLSEQADFRRKKKMENRTTHTQFLFLRKRANRARERPGLLLEGHFRSWGEVHS